MEMATPLPDLTELPPDEYIDPPSIPLPASRSPSPLSSPGAALSPRAVRGISESSVEPSHHSRSSTTREEGHIQDLEARLAAAREDLEEKEDALQELREELERLRIQAPAGQESLDSADLLS